MTTVGVVVDADVVADRVVGDVDGVADNEGGVVDEVVDVVLLIVFDASVVSVVLFP